MATRTARGATSTRRGTVSAQKPVVTGPLRPDELTGIDAWWRAANYLSVGQIYLLDDPLLRGPLRPEHIKPRLLGHWGTTPGLNFLWAHANRVIRERDFPALFVTGPGHGGPAIAASTWLEGTYTEVYPDVSGDEAGMLRLFGRFSFPGGIGSHVTPEMPGSIHEGGELGYALSHAYGAAFDDPGLVVFCVVGDGEAETGPLAASWKSVRFVDPVHDGAVLPILHLNGYKIANPTVLARIPGDELERCSGATGIGRCSWRETTRPRCTSAWPRSMDEALDAIATIQRRARGRERNERPAWPMIILRSPKGWTGPKEVDGLPTEGSFRSHQVPLNDVRGRPEHMAILEAWLRSYHPDELFDAEGRPMPAIEALAPLGDRRMSANPRANGGRVLRDLALPDFRDYAVEVPRPAATTERGDQRHGHLPP